MKKTLFALAICLGLVFTTAWLVVRPVYAMNVEVTCRDGSKRSCTGQTCTGSDFVENGTNGWCQCTSYTPGSPADVEDCDHEKDGDLPKEPPQN